MENQIDKIINNPTNWDKVGGMLANFPTKSNVRIKHAIKLAVKLNEQYALTQQLKKELEENRKNMVRLQGE